MREVTAGLWLVGIGPGDIDAMSLEAVEVASGCDHRFLEGYTALLPPAQEELLTERIGGWTKLMRPAVENPDELLGLAEKSSVALLVVGDPLQATTHVDLQLRARDRGIACEVIHGISVTTIVTGALGLQSYRFGRQVTLAYPHGDYLPTSPLEMVITNREQNLHTLMLLDLDPTGMGEGEQRPMSPADAIAVIRKTAAKLGADVESWMFVLCSDVGTSESRLVCGTAEQISSVEGGRIHCLVIPGSLDELEELALERWRV
jgi:diphthine synthase